jgi:hypothetical protein
MKLLGLKPFFGRSLNEVVEYLRIDVAKGFSDLFAVLNSVKLAEDYAEASMADAASFSATATAMDIAQITLPPGDWNVFGAVLFDSNGSSNPTGTAWISLASLSSTGTVLGKSIVGAVPLTSTGYRQVSVFRRVTLGQRSNVYLGASSVYTAGGPIKALGSIWAIGRK